MMNTVLGREGKMVYKGKQSLYIKKERRKLYDKILVLKEEIIAIKINLLLKKRDLGFKSKCLAFKYPGSKPLSSQLTLKLHFPSKNHCCNSCFWKIYMPGMAYTCYAVPVATI